MKLSEKEMAFVLDCICYYDKRNPENEYLYGDDPDIIRRDDCMCDNCFRGLHKLAEITLKLIGDKMTFRNWFISLGKKDQPCGCGRNCDHTTACKKFSDDARKAMSRVNRKTTRNKNV